ncbi:MAG: hypothetical protein DWH80_00830 [Planctomycetota bacterium]|nr:MAG: hypothetical protein DWH80_00830 [Planctomycetota bacterium]
MQKPRSTQPLGIGVNISNHTVAIFRSPLVSTNHLSHRDDCSGLYVEKLNSFFPMPRSHG